MKLLTKIINYFSEEVEEADTDLKEVRESNLDWRVVALDLNRSLIESQEKLQNANQRIADLEKIVATYKEKENVK
ncbi:hypothetical protein [Streptococcus oralis]|uniref:hypothetical protein n=1 Tax=Streptococcus oralis TaxID=1303 RepID=UPI0007106B88|nr:hypothetical protein [Streptococcus oralis]DAR75665.1 MAG TPA: hypothetical protein [Bacteriophage sp.]